MMTQADDNNCKRMSESKPVSLRVDDQDLRTVREAGLVPADIMRAALHAKARALRAEAWARESRSRRVTPGKGAPTTETLLRESRDER